MTLTTITLAAALELLAAMSLAWLAQYRTGNCGWVDVAWSFGTGLAGITLALAPLDGHTPDWRQWAVAALIAAWSLRLGLHIAARAAQGIDDPRYAALRVEWAAAFQWRLAVFLLIQASVALGLAASMALAARNPQGGGPLDILGIAVLIIGITGEGAADRTLRRFKANPANRGRICDIGLWAWSRHPNYFFEWFGWLAYPLLAISSGWPWGWLALSGPALMFWALRHASGVPPLEAHMAGRYGPAWAAYTARVSIFFPRPPTREATP